MIKRNLAVAATTALIASVAVYQWLEGPDPGMDQGEFSDVDIAAGARLYAENCASCHGDALQGQPNWQTALDDGSYPAPPHDETGHTWHHDDAMLFSYSKDGGAATLAAQGVTNFKSGMPGFAEVLSDQEIRNILGYIKSTWPERIQEQRKRRLAQSGA